MIHVVPCCQAYAPAQLKKETPVKADSPKKSN
jgi:hypothetical protein